MKTYTAILFTLLFSVVYAQNEQTGTKVGRQTPQEQFHADLKNDSLNIYTVGGLKPSNHKADTAFQETYKIDYHDFGCIAPPDMDYYVAYNLLVFQHLNERWGKSWEKDIKDNAMNFYQWKEAK